MVRRKPAPDARCGGAPAVEIAFLERESFADPQPGTPQQHDQRPKPVTVRTVADRAHDGDDFLNWSADQPDPLRLYCAVDGLGDSRASLPASGDVQRRLAARIP